MFQSLERLKIRKFEKLESFAKSESLEISIPPNLITETLRNTNLRDTNLWWFQKFDRQRF